MNRRQPRERSRHEKVNRKRGVSDVVAFVLMFSIIIAGVGLVSTGGFDQLTHFTNSQQLENSDRGMQAAASSVENLQQNSDTYREFDLSLGGGNVWFNETKITLDGSGDITEIGDDGTVSVNALEHRFELSSGVTNLTYEGGAVFRTGSAITRYEPAITVDEDRNQAIISLVNLTTDESIDRSGAFASEIVLSPTGVPQEAPVAADKQFISFSAERVDQQQVYETGNLSTLEVDVSKTAYPDQWAFYFDDSERWEENGDEHVYTPSDIDSVLVRVTTVELSLLERDPL